MELNKYFEKLQFVPADALVLTISNNMYENRIASSYDPDGFLISILNISMYIYCISRLNHLSLGHSLCHGSVTVFMEANDCGITRGATGDLLLSFIC